jgi:hypothetical protein
VVAATVFSMLFCHAKQPNDPILHYLHANPWSKVLVPYLVCKMSIPLQGKEIACSP